MREWLIKEWAKWKTKILQHLKNCRNIKKKYEKDYEEKWKSFLLKEIRDVQRIKKIEKNVDKFK